jgi:hypothetical protein
VAALAAERQEARQEALKREEENRARQRDKEVEKEQEEAVRYEEEMMMLLDDLETLFAGLRKAEAMHKQALEEEQIRERERVEHATKAELDVRGGKGTLTSFTPPFPVSFLYYYFIFVSLTISISFVSAITVYLFIRTWGPPYSSTAPLSPSISIILGRSHSSFLGLFLNA